MQLNFIKKHIRVFELFFIASLVAVSASVMTLSAKKWDVWHDESFTAALLHYAPEKIVEITAKDVHPPLFYLVLKTWSAVFGQDIVVLRMFSIVTMSAALVSMYYLFKKLFGRQVAIAAGLCMAVGPMTLRYGSEARMYALASLLVSFQLHAFVDMIRGNMSRRTRILYVFCSVAAFYVHYYTFLLVVTQWLYLMSKTPRTKGWHTIRDIKERCAYVWRTYKDVFAPLGIAIALWLPIAARQALEIQTAFWVRWVGHESVYSTLTTFLLFRDSYGLVRYDLTLSMFSVVAFCTACWYVYRYDKSIPRSTYKLTAWFFAGPVALLFAFSLVARSTYYDRYFSMFGYVFYGLVGVVIYRTLCVVRWQMTTRLLLVAGIVLSLTVGMWRLQQFGDFDGDRNRFQMRAAYSYIACRRQPTDIIIVKGLLLYYDARYYFSDIPNLKALTDGPLNGWGNTAPITGTGTAVTSLQEVTQSGRTIWVIVPTGDQLTVPHTWQDQHESFEKGYVRVYKYSSTIDRLYY